MRTERLSTQLSEGTIGLLHSMSGSERRVGRFLSAATLLLWRSRDVVVKEWRATGDFHRLAVVVNEKPPTPASDGVRGEPCTK